MTTQGLGVSASHEAVVVPPLPLAFDGSRVRVITDEQGSPWFVALDLLDLLNLDRKAMERLDDDEKGVAAIHTPGGVQSMTTVNEPGLYSLILGSRKPEAKRFKRWVTHEVLPAIRRTGHYGAAPQAAAGLTPDEVVQITTTTVQQLLSRQPKPRSTRRAQHSTIQLHFEQAESTDHAIVAVLAEAHANGAQRLTTRRLVEEVQRRFGRARGSILNALTRMQRDHLVVRPKPGLVRLSKPETVVSGMSPLQPAAPGTISGRLVLMDLIYRLAVAAGRAVSWADIRQHLSPEQTTAIGLQQVVEAMESLQALDAGHITTDNGIAFKAGKDIARLPWLMA
jgi:prophage antirepressor-like protein